MRISDLNLGLENIAGPKTRIPILDVEARWRRDAQGRNTEELDGYNFYIMALGGSLQPIKLPASAKPEFEAAKQAIDDGDMVFIASLKNFKAKVYCIAGTSRSGVSCSADAIKLHIVHVEAADEDDPEFAL